MTTPEAIVRTIVFKLTGRTEDFDVAGAAKEIEGLIAAERRRCETIAEQERCEDDWACDCGHNHADDILARIRSGR